MSNKTINQALKDLYTGLGGDPQALADNSTCSDYIEDLESAIKGAASGAQIDDTTASETTVFSSAKTEELINGIEALPSVAVGDIGEALIVESDGEGGAQWGKGAIKTPKIFRLNDGNENLLKLVDCTIGDVCKAYDNGNLVVLNGNNNNLYTCLGKLVGAATGVYYLVFVGAYYTTKGSGNVLDIMMVNFDYNTTSTSVNVSKNNKFSALPYVTASDNDKILKVVNGVWTAVTPQ